MTNTHRHRRSPLYSSDRVHYTWQRAHPYLAGTSRRIGCRFHLYGEYSKQSRAALFAVLSPFSFITSVLRIGFSGADCCRRNSGVRVSICTPAPCYAVACALVRRGRFEVSPSVGITPLVIKNISPRRSSCFPAGTHRTEQKV